jgi:hypothetical protein
MIPTSIICFWFLGLFSWVLLGAGIYLSHKWYQRAWSYDFNLHRSYFDPHIGNNYETFLLAVAVGLLLWVLAGGVFVRGILNLFTKTKGSAGRDALPKRSRQGAREYWLSRPDGSKLRIECCGREDAPPIILTHGWGANSTEWDYLKKELSGDFQLIVWDLPGLGKSTRPTNRDYSMENLSRDLEAVLELTGDRPAILLGHSIGGMITLTFCRLFPEALRARAAGYRSCADYLHQPGSHDEDGKFLYRAAASGYRSASASHDLVVAAGLAVELDELPERFRVFIDKKQRVCRDRDLGGT